MNAKNLFSKRNITLLSLIFVSNILMSPKWTIAIATWVYFLFILRFYRENNWKGFLLSLPVLIVSSFIAQVKVMPMPAGFVLVLLSVFSLINLIPFILDSLLRKHLAKWTATLVFPISYTLLTFFLDSGPQGTWGNSAYTQYSFLPLMQVASVTGIYGVNFLICWAASTLNYIYECTIQKERIGPWAFIMPGILTLVLVFGLIQLGENSEQGRTSRMATLTLENNSVVKSMYEAEMDTSISLPLYFSQSDPIVDELQKGITAFMADPKDERFLSVYDEMDLILEKYLDATRNAASSGAKVITWSEAAIINIKDRENEYADKVAKLARELQVYIFYPTAVFHPEKVGKEDLFIENKVLTIGPKGELFNTYFKNSPVMGVEPSFPGDGKVPLIETTYGNLSPVICYDADHPKLISQVSELRTEVLVVPTGDWKAISPYHTHMAAVRCIENGVSMIKATSNGMSAVVDNKGRILASKNYWDESGVKSIIYDVPIAKTDTLYSAGNKVFIFILKGAALALIVIALFRFFKSRSSKLAGRKTTVLQSV